MTVLYAYVLEHTGSGPLWGQLVEENARICRENMWRNLIYAHNFWPFEQMVSVSALPLAALRALSKRCRFNVEPHLRVDFVSSVLRRQ